MQTTEPLLSSLAERPKQEQAAVTLAAICGTPQSATALMQMVNRADIRNEKGNKLTSGWKQIREELIRLGFLVENRGRLACATELAASLCRQAAEQGRYQRWLEASVELRPWHGSALQHCLGRPCDHPTDLATQLRHALYCQQPEYVERLLYQECGLKRKYGWELSSGAFWAQVFGSDADRPWIEHCLQGVERVCPGQVLAGIWQQRLETPGLSLDLPADQHDAIIRSAKQHSLVLVDRALLVGDISELTTLAAGQAGACAEAFAKGCLATLSQQDPEAACLHFSAGIDAWRRFTKRRNNTPRTATLLLYLHALLCQQRHDRLQELAADWTQHRAPQFFISHGRFIGGLLHPTTDGPTLFAKIKRLPASYWPCMERRFRLCFHLMAGWIDPQQAAKAIADTTAAADFQHAGLHWAAQEMRLAQAQRDDDQKFSSLAQAAQARGTATLVGSYQSPPVWRLQLKQLAAAIPRPLTNSKQTPASSDTRLAWLVTWQADEQGHITSWIGLTPVEQKNGPKGWSKGRPIALKRLAQKEGRLPPCSPQDENAIRCIGQESVGWYGDINWYIDPGLALPLLLDHPHLFRDLDGERLPLRLQYDAIRLLIGRDDDHISLRLDPSAAHIRKAQHCLYQAEGIDTLLLRPISPCQQKLAINWLDEVLTIPTEGEAEVHQLLQDLAPHIRVVGSGVTGEDTREQAVENLPRLHLRRDADGALVGNLRQIIGSEAYQLGRGPTRLLHYDNKQAISLVRDHERERNARTQLLERCPQLAQTLDDHDDLRCEHPEEALALLQQCQQATDLVELATEALPRYRGQIEKRQVRWHLGANQAGWLELGAELDIDEDLAVDASSLLNKQQQLEGRFLHLPDGSIVALQRELAQQLADLRASIQPAHKKSAPPRLSSWAALQLFANEAALTAPADWKKLQQRCQQALNIAVPNTLQAQLRDYQEDGFRWLAQLADLGAGACLADDMGLGKTIQSLALLLHRRQDGPTLVVAPTSVCSNWLRECQRFAPTITASRLAPTRRQQQIKSQQSGDLLVISYTLLQQEIDRLETVTWGTVILDEAQAIKNQTTNRARAAKRLTAHFRLALSGTPVENRITELWSLFDFLLPGLLGNAEHFAREFAVPIEQDGSRPARERLHRLLRPFLLRRNKVDVLHELPIRTDIRHEVSFSKDERAFYEAIRRQAVQELEQDESGSNRMQILAQLMRLRRACCHPTLVDPAADDSPSAKQSALEEILEELLDGGHRALVFSQFVDHLSCIRQQLDQAGIDYQYLDGSTPSAERDRRVAAFQNGEGALFLISLKAGGTGLNLTGADYVIHLDPWWNPAVEDQATDRAHRIGQQRPVTVYRLIVQDTIEQAIVELHDRKRDLATDILDGNAEVLSPSALLDLIREPKASL